MTDEEAKGIARDLIYQGATEFIDVVRYLDVQHGLAEEDFNPEDKTAEHIHDLIRTACIADAPWADGADWERVVP